MALLGILIGALWLAAFAICLELLFPKFFKRRRRRPRRKPPAYAYSLPVSPLYSRLLNMLNGDQVTAQRLVAFTQECYPNRPQQWCLEKAIYDLERDRR